MATQVFLQQLITKPDRLKNLVDEAKEMAFQHGVVIRIPETPNSSEVVTHLPFALFPSPVPKAALLQALAVQTHYNTLVDKISQDPDFLGEALAETIQADDFTAKLFGIYRQVQRESRTQVIILIYNVNDVDNLALKQYLHSERIFDISQDNPELPKNCKFKRPVETFASISTGIFESIVVGLNRSDYMLDQREDGTSALKQIEINTIAAGGFSMTDQLSVVHRHILRSAGLLEEIKCVQDANKTSGMNAALAKGWELYGQQKAVILFLVENFQMSIFAHRCMENELWNRNIPVIRRTFEEVSRRGSLDDDKKLFIDGLEVAVVYFRYGYMPDNYTEQTWDARLLIERSLAVKCPDISTHLAGTKKVQQVLARPGVLEKFFPDQPQVVEQIRATFAGLYTLDMGPEGDRTVAMALANPDKFVLKPQREGGGNNYFGEDIVRVLQEVKGDKRRAAYILMDKIRPRTEQNILLRKGLPLKLTSVCSEIGVCGAYVRHGGEMILNEVVGHLLRTKSIEHNDGGIAKGVAVYNNLLIV